MWRAELLKTSVFTKEPMREMVSTLSKDSDEKRGLHGRGGGGGWEAELLERRDP